MFRFLPCLLVLLLGGCAANPSVSVTNSPQQRDHDWQTASLAQSGFDTTKMTLFNERLESGWHPNAHAVLVEYDGKLVYEAYLDGEDEAWGVSVGHREFSQSSRHDLRSITKSVTSLLLGIALGDDFEAALAQPVIEYFPEFADQVAPGVEQVTLHHVLTMTTGFEWNEMELPYSNLENDARRMYHAADPVQYLLNKPLTSKPGEAWYYNGASTMLLAALVEKISGQPFLEFAQLKLANPLGIPAEHIEWRGRGIWPERRELPSAASGLRTTARDLAKFGSLVLNQGRWRGQQLVPREWIEISSRRHTEQTFSTWSHGGIYGYGYQWWHGEFGNGDNHFTAISGVGFGGQRLFIIPEKNMVVTIFAGNYGNGIWRMSEQVLLEIIAAAP